MQGLPVQCTHTYGILNKKIKKVIHRLGKVKGAIYEAAAILKDYRMQAIGGMMGMGHLGKSYNIQAPG